MYKKKTYLITGASGFIGSVLLRRLVNNGEIVHIILRSSSKTWRIQDLLPKVSIYYSDLSNVYELEKIIKRVKPDIIYHFAVHGAYSNQTDQDLIIKTNFFGTWNLIKSLSSHRYLLFVNVGSSSEYGFKDKPMSEGDLLEPASYYAVSKAAQTLLLSYIAKFESKPIVTLRPFSVYGPWEESTRFIPSLMKSLMSGESMNLVSASVVRDFIYVDDFIDACLAISKLCKYPGEIFNIGSGVQTSITSVVRKAQKITKSEGNFILGGMENRIWDTNKWVADISKARKLLGWYPKVSLEEGLRMMWKWYQENKDKY